MNRTQHTASSSSSSASFTAQQHLIASVRGTVYPPSGTYRGASIAEEMVRKLREELGVCVLCLIVCALCIRVWTLTTTPPALLPNIHHTHTHTHATQNPLRRSTMEDVHRLVPCFDGDAGTSFVGIYDGHGGACI